MKVAGIICEYNPFHNGHKYQLEQVKKQFDAVICVMSGSFVQRGDVALFDKWTRARAALENGADLVLELPVCYCLSSAHDFARGGVEILNATGVCDALCFGSESTDIDALRAASDFICNETPEISQKIRNNMDSGLSYPAALTRAYDGLIDSRLLSSPNDILALEYICAINSVNSSMVPIPMHRKNVDHHSQVPSDGFASASSVRSFSAAGEDISLYVPFDYSPYEKYNINHLTDIFKYIIISQGTNAFSDIPAAENGIARRFIKFADENALTEIIDKVKTKRYTRTRLARIALSVILGLKGPATTPEYIRVLGMTDSGRKILSEMRTVSTLPIINKTADHRNIQKLYEDIRATDISALCADKPVEKGRDFTTSPIFINT